MRRLQLLIALIASLIACASALVAAVPAMAYDVSAVYRDCETNGQLTGHYSRAELQSALSNLPSQMAEYSACQAIIQQALLSASKPGGGPRAHSAVAGATGGRGRGSGGKGSSRRAARRHSTLGRTKKARSHSGTGNAVPLSGSNVRPASVGSSATRSLPGALLVVLILLGLTAVTGGALAIRRRVVTRQGT